MDPYNNTQVAYILKLMGDVKEAAHRNIPTFSFCTFVLSFGCLIYVMLLFISDI